MPLAVRVIDRLQDLSDVETPDAGDGGKVYAYDAGLESFVLSTVLTDGTGYLPLTGGTLSGDLTLDNGIKINTDQVQARDNSGLLLTEDGGAGILIQDGTAAVLVNGLTAVTGAQGAAQVQVLKTSPGNLLLVQDNVTADNGATLEILRRRSGTTILQADDRIGSIVFSGIDGVDVAAAAGIAAFVDGTPGSDDMPGRLIFYTVPDGSVTLTEAMRINALQNLIIANGKRIESDELRARDSSGLTLVEDGGVGLFVEDGTGSVLVNGSVAVTGFISAAQVQISKTSPGNLLLVQDSATAGNGPSIEIMRRRSAFTVLQSGDRVGTILFSGADSVDAAPVAQIIAEVDGTPGSNDMPGRMVFGTTADGANAITESFRVDSSQNLIVANGKRIETDEVRARDTSGLTLSENGGTIGLQIQNSTGVVLVNTSSVVTGTQGAAQVQINKTSPGNLLLVEDNTTAANGPTLELTRRRTGTTVLQSGDTVGTIAFSGMDGVDAAAAAAIAVFVDGTPGSNDMPGRMLFYTVPDGSQTLTEAMRINASQNLIIADGKRIETDEVRARDTGGLKLYNASGAGLFVEDTTGDVGVGTTSPTARFHIDGPHDSIFQLVNVSDGNRGGYMKNTSSAVEFGSNSSIRDFILATDATEQMRIVAANGNIGLFSMNSFGSGARVLGVKNATTNPSTNPTGGGILYADAGAGKWRGSSGTVTTFGPAEPHCPTCGSDYMKEFDNEEYGYFSICLKCLADELGERAWIVRGPSKLKAS